MRFTLVYEGSLASNGSPKAKHDIRRQLHPQLKQLWLHEPLVGDEQWLIEGPNEDDGFLLSTTSGRSFAALVHPYLKLYAELDILMLRPEPPGTIVVTGGDIDNRLKTLFDALRVPDKPQEVPSGWLPADDEQPLHCLLHDDRLISRVNVETDRLLEPVTQRSFVRLVIRVTIKAFAASWGNLSIIA